MSVTLAELKAHLRVDSADEDTELAIYLAAALDYVEVETGRKLSNEARVSYFDALDDMELIGDNPTSVVVTYVDEDGNSQTLSSSIYALKTHEARPYLTLAYDQNYPSTRVQDAAVSVAYTSGYTSGTLPDGLKSAVFLVAGQLYEFREAATMVKTTVNEATARLIHHHKIYTL